MLRQFWAFAKFSFKYNKFTFIVIPIIVMFSLVTELGVNEAWDLAKNELVGAKPKANIIDLDNTVASKDFITFLGYEHKEQDLEKITILEGFGEALQNKGTATILYSKSDDEELRTKTLLYQLGGESNIQIEHDMEAPNIPMFLTLLFMFAYFGTGNTIIEGRREGELRYVANHINPWLYLVLSVPLISAMFAYFLFTMPLITLAAAESALITLVYSLNASSSERSTMHLLYFIGGLGILSMYLAAKGLFWLPILNLLYFESVSLLTVILTNALLVGGVLYYLVNYSGRITE